MEERNYYFANEIPHLLNEHTPSYTTFYRCVRAGKIKRSNHAGQDTYDKEDVNAFLRGNFSTRSKRRSSLQSTEKNMTTEKVPTQLSSVAQIPISIEERPDTSSFFASAATGATDWIKESDLPYVFALDYEVYGLDATVSPLITRTWWQKNPFACRILFDQENRKDVWGALTILPMKEEDIFHILSEQMEERDIHANQVLPYEAGKSYAGYVASAAIRPEHRYHFRLLIESVLSFWCEQYPQMELTKLYAYALGDASSDGWRLIRKLFFAPLYERGGYNFKNAWELRLNSPSPSKIITHYQKCIQSKIEQGENSMSSIVIENRNIENAYKKKDPAQRFTGETIRKMTFRAEVSQRFRAAVSEEDIRAIVEIGDSIFGASNVADNVLVNLFLAWSKRNQEIFHVLEVDGYIEAFTSLLPLHQTKIDAIIQDKIRMSAITSEDILVFEPDKPVNLFVHVVGVRPTENRGVERTRNHKFGGQLLQGMAAMFADWAEHGIRINSIYARSNTIYGKGLSGELGFIQIDPPPPGASKPVFFLDVQTSPIFEEYRRLLRIWEENTHLV